MIKKGFLFLMFIMVLRVSSALGITQIPVQFLSGSQLPVIEVEVEGEVYYLELDTGAVGDVIVTQEVLEKICNKTDQSVIKTVDIKGNIYENSQFLISEIKIGGLSFESVMARQENVALLTEGCVVRNPMKNQEGLRDKRLTNIVGRIGCGMLQKHQWYFDFFHSLIWVVDDLRELEQELPYFSIRDYVEIPFEMNGTGVVIEVDIGFGVKKFMLDTGSNIFCLRESGTPKKHAEEFEPGKWTLLSKVKIAGVDFGNYPFFLYDFTSMFNVDGILGIQFFERNGIYLDFQNKRALIGPAKRSFWLRLIDRVECFWGWLTY